jgi:sulfate transport system permease protein
VRVIFPLVLPSILTGGALAMARAFGEYGSVIFISANIPLQSQIVPHLIVEKLEAYEYAAATVLGSAMLVCSFIMLLALNLLQRWSRRYQEQ